jgi:glycosyltransferase involved in cell wall biosynthesis
VTRPTVAVVLSCYNSPLIEPQIESILKQSEPADQVIIVDDSTDTSIIEIIRRAVERLGRLGDTVQIVRNERNLGMRASYEKGLQLVRTEVVALCDHDDIWFPQKLAVVRDAFVASATVGVVHDVVLFGGEGSPVGPVGPRLSEVTGWRSHRRHNRRAVPAATLLRKNRFSGTALAVRTELIDNVLPFPNDIFPDHWIAMVAVAKGDLMWLDEPLVHYRRHDGNSVVLPGDPSGTKSKRAQLPPTIELPSAETVARLCGLASHHSTELSRWQRMLEVRSALNGGAPLRALRLVSRLPGCLLLYPMIVSIPADVVRCARSFRKKSPTSELA